MGRHRNVPEGGEDFDDRAMSSDPRVAVVGEDLHWTCADYPFTPPTEGKCQATFSIQPGADGAPPQVPEGWQWSESAGYVGYVCPEHALPGYNTTDDLVTPILEERVKELHCALLDTFAWSIPFDLQRARTALKILEDLVGGGGARREAVNAVRALANYLEGEYDKERRELHARVEKRGGA